VWLCLCSYCCVGQTFINGTLDGPPITAFSILPYGWQAIPRGDLVCEATHDASATPDLTDLSGPSVAYGAFGIAHSAPTYIGGLHLRNSSILYHEGIQQTVSNLDTSCAYKLSFWQAVDKQEYTIDTSGGWQVYAGNTLLHTSLASISNTLSNDPNLQWDYREFVFQPESSSILFKFLPRDDDSNQKASLVDENGAIRMAIDDITLEQVTISITDTRLLPDTAILCQEVPLVLTVANVDYTDVLWSTGATTSSITTDTPQRIWVRAQSSCHIYTDTALVIAGNCICDIDLPNAFTPNGDGLNDIISIPTNCNITDLSFKVFNRWGQNVFTTTVAEKTWDGYYKGHLLPQDAYYYTLQYSTLQGNKRKQGDILLMR
jgi:gliding motility-associated-like protein